MCRLCDAGDSLLAAIEAGNDDEDQPESKAAAAKKKRKVGVANGIAAAAHEEGPRGEFSGHTQCVSGLAMASEGGWWVRDQVLLACGPAIYFGGWYGCHVCRVIKRVC